jgi:NAD(P)-dependent dehydrogenase (short-subunit alcohol dehydrogenase family)
VQSYDAEKAKTFGKKTQFGRPAQPADLAPAYVFLATADSRFMTSEVVGVTGGEVLG